MLMALRFEPSRFFLKNSDNQTKLNINLIQNVLEIMKYEI